MKQTKQQTMKISFAFLILSFFIAVVEGGPVATAFFDLQTERPTLAAQNADLKSSGLGDYLECSEFAEEGDSDFLSPSDLFGGEKVSHDLYVWLFSPALFHRALNDSFDSRFKILVSWPLAISDAFWVQISPRAPPSLFA